MTYRAPVAEIAFTMRHVAGLDRPIAEGLHGDLSLDLVEAILDEAGKLRQRRARAAQPRRRPRRHCRSRTARSTMPPRLQGRLPGLGRGRLERAAGPGRVRRPGPADAAQLGLHRDVERGLPRLRPRAAADHRRHRGARAARLGGPEGAAISPSSSAGEWTATMNLTEPQAGSDLDALRTPRRAGRATAATGSPARRSSSPTASTT